MGPGTKAGGPFSNTKAVRVLAIVHLAGLGLAAAVNPGDVSGLLYYPALLLVGAVSFIIWVYLWHYNLRHNVTSIRLTKSIAAPYVVDEIDGRWISARNAFAMDRSHSGDEILRLRGLGVKLANFQMAPTATGLAMRWFPGQRRFIPWSDVLPLEPVEPSDVFRSESPLSPFFKATLKMRPVGQFAVRQCPNLRFMLPMARALKVQEASGNLWLQPASPLTGTPLPPSTPPPPGI